MKNHSEIQCPNCGGTIYLDTKLLLQGANFSCSNQHCDATVALSNTSYQVTQDAMNEFEDLRANGL